MPRGLFMETPERLYIAEYEEPVLKSNEVRIRSEFSAIKHGTDLFWLSGKTPFHKMDFDSKLRLFVNKTAEDPSQARPFGNMTVGTVVEVGSEVTKFKVGDKVYTYGPIAETVIGYEDHYTEHLVPPMNASDAVCMDPAFYAFAAVRDASVKVGDNVVVFGLGSIGMFVVQLLKLSGCMDIIAVDPIQKRRELAQQHGATLTLDPTQCDVALAVREHLTRDGAGADIAIVASGSYKALQESLRSVQNCGTIVSLGYYHGQGHDLSLGQEWHHNRLTLISSMPVWGNPVRDYPLWNNDRMEVALRQMFQRGLLSSENLVDPVVDFEDAAEAILNVYRNPNDSIKLAVRY